MSLGITRGTPFGCVVGLLALLPLCLSGLGISGWIAWLALPENKRPQSMESLWISCTVGGLILGIVLLWLAVKIHRRTDWQAYDANKPFSQN